MSDPALTTGDLEWLASRGIGAVEAWRQLALLREPPARLEIDRPCTVGDGIERLDAARRATLATAHDEAAAAGRWMRFVPASGAATRMFGALLAVRSRDGPTRDSLERGAAGGDPDARSALATLEGIERFAFRDALDAALVKRGLSLATCRARGDARTLFDTLLEPSGLGYASRPKGMLAFHRDDAGARTAFEEQLREAITLGRAVDGVTRAHFTVSPEHRALFERALVELRPSLERMAPRLDVGFSGQEPATDTLALGDDGAPVRAGGRLLLRPAGHGALIDNLGAIGGDLVSIKNVDNVQPEIHRAASIEWARVLTGRLLELERRVHGLLLRLEDPRDAEAPAEAIAFVTTEFGGVAGVPLEGGRAHVWALLHRPLRVCGMVPNTGEPGGGPFWVRDRRDGITRQIVESAEVDLTRPVSRTRFASGTHFNPVYLVCGLRDHRGTPYPLAEYVDPAAVILTRKSANGRGLLALERPGLWNGAMARWLTVFVEVPLEVFTPVKEVNDLLRPEHQP
ncbi:MAG: DUF4301 family protein [Candidatus Eisenbacteria bacterium]